jgi:rubrerythrin
MIITTPQDIEVRIFLKELEQREIERYKALGKPYDKYRLTPEGIKELRHFLYFSDRAKAGEEREIKYYQQMSAACKKDQAYLFRIFLILLVMAVGSAFVAMFG